MELRPSGCSEHLHNSRVDCLPIVEWGADDGQAILHRHARAKVRASLKPQRRLQRRLLDVIRHLTPDVIRRKEA
jgi:hypothetical protein